MEAALDIVPLHVLAEHMRDRTWLDVVTEEGVIDRVRIVEIVVRREDERLKLVQQYLDDDECLQRYHFAIEAELVWSVAPTVHEWPGDVTPLFAQATFEREKGTVLNPGDEQRLVETVLRGAMSLWQLRLDELRKVYDGHHIGPRYACMICLYEMSNLASEDICQALGYLSVQPLVSARHDMTSRHSSDAQRWRIDATKRLGKLVDDQMAPLKCRTARAYPSDYRPVLGP